VDWRDAVIWTGVVLPTFRETPDDALGAADDAVNAGVDGLFCYDHIWPLGEPDRPALAPFPILGALATRFAPRGDRAGPFVGTLVARVGLVPDDVLFEQFVALHHLAPGRVIAALGTGDQMSAAENRAYGIPYPTAAARRTTMVALARRLRGRGLTVWIAGGRDARVEEPTAAGVALNLWDVDAALLAERKDSLAGLEVTWAGPPPSAPLEPTVAELARAGATWVVFGWPVDVDELVAAARAAVPG
jgi:alkanesulfonate monooxygenase SsuD/methylene tetrahydromethanopterin reductase-like flavin-dependent oxidoreductase (luciferase family)